MYSPETKIMSNLNNLPGNVQVEIFKHNYKTLYNILEDFYNDKSLNIIIESNKEKLDDFFQRNEEIMNTVIPEGGLPEFDINPHPSKEFLAALSIKENILKDINERNIFAVYEKHEVILPEVKKALALSDCTYAYFNLHYKMGAKLQDAFICAMYFASAINGSMLEISEGRQKMLGLLLCKYYIGGKKGDLRENAEDFRRMRVCWDGTFMTSVFFLQKLSDIV